MTHAVDAGSVCAPHRWGLPTEAVADLANRLQRIWARFHDCFITKTRDTSDYALSYLRGLLTMDTDRNYANIARRVIDPDADGQHLQQFMSDSPWASTAVFAQIQDAIRAQPELHGGMLTLDESADERAGDQRAGAARQSLGRFGKVDLGQVGVALGYDHHGIWTLVDAELEMPEVWFDVDHADLRRRWHIPSSRTFASKPDLGRALIRRAQARGLPFTVGGCDSLYGRASQFRADLDAENIMYMADIPSDTQVYLDPPHVGVPRPPRGKRGRPATRPRVLTASHPVEVRTLLPTLAPRLPPVAIRQSERGLLTDACVARRVWTLTPAGVVREEWLFMRQEHDGPYRFSLSNAPTPTPLVQLARWRCQRYFGERTFQDAKSEAGWDALVARKYRAWMHHTALDALALWFVAETKLDWAQTHPRDPALIQQLEVAVLPALSMANVREVLQAVLPLQQLSLEQATRVVINHLVHRSRSTRSRLKKQRRTRGPT